MGTVQRLYHTLPAQSTPSSAFIGHPPTTAVTAYISITKNENSYAIKKVMHRVWAYFQARLAFTMAAFNVLVQWHGLRPNAAGFVPLSMAEFSL
jgi:hypothetical protein